MGRNEVGEERVFSHGLMAHWKASPYPRAMDNHRGVSVNSVAESHLHDRSLQKGCLGYKQREAGVGDTHSKASQVVLVTNGEDLSQASTRGDGEEEADGEVGRKTGQGKAAKPRNRGVMED